jgi:hypothetical protein
MNYALIIDACTLVKKSDKKTQKYLIKNYSLIMSMLDDFKSDINKYKINCGCGSVLSISYYLGDESGYMKSSHKMTKKHRTWKEEIIAEPSYNILSNYLIDDLCSIVFEYSFEFINFDCKS